MYIHLNDKGDNVINFDKVLLFCKYQDKDLQFRFVHDDYVIIQYCDKAFRDKDFKKIVNAINKEEV